MTIRFKSSSVLIAASLLIGSCGSDTPAAIDATATSAVEVSAPTETTSVGTPPTEPPVETTVAPTTTTSSVPGEPLAFGIGEGTELGIIGVEVDDSLNFRTQPSAVAEIVDSVLTLDERHSIISRGDSWATPTSVWWHLTVDGEEAWANQKYLAAFGATDDITSQIVATASSVTAETARELALSVAALRASTDPVSTIVVVSDEPGSPSSLAEVIVDVIGLGDDAQKGERLHVFANVVYDEDEETIISFELKSVEATLLCSRGVTGPGSDDVPEGFCL